MNKQNGKILIVEDNEMNRDMLKRRLERVGFSVSVAEHGGLVFECVEKDRPDLILLDLSLPVMDGWEVARRLKADEKTAKIPIIALTAHAMVEELESTLKAGCDDYDTKPVDFKRLTDKIAVLLKPMN